LKLFDQVCARLDGAAVRYAVIGAAAMGLHGVSRSTFDLDILVVDGRVLEAAFWQGLAADVRPRRGEADDPLAGVVRIESAGAYPVDVIVGRFAWQTSLLERAERFSVGDGKASVATAADLILLKLFAGGAQDRWDIQQLLHVNPEAANEVEARLGQLPPEAAALWALLRARKS
jgi:hypothetical protein